MVVVTLRRALTAAALCLLPVAAAAQSPASLSEAWLASLKTTTAPVPWSHAVVAQHPTLDELAQRRLRLAAELDTLMASSRLAGFSELGEGLSEWIAQLNQVQPLHLRTPGRRGLPWIAADLRRDLPLEKVARWGYCTPPGWVELWHYRGITRVAWQPDMQLRDALADLPQAAHQGANRAAVVTPLGEILERGMASWNREATPLAQGSRVMLRLPEAQGLRAALPFPGTVEEAGWVNRQLPRFLATLLPGDQCQLWEP